MDLRPQPKLLGLPLLLVVCLAFECAPTRADEIELSKFHPAKAPTPKNLMLKEGDRLAICGDSITEQKMYSRIMEDYLTMCVPELKVTVRQYGWSGEKAPGFLKRMTNDCLRFKPTIATTCYGMNDHEYRSYEPRIGNTYRSNSMAVVEAFLANGVRVIQGSPGCVGKVPSWHSAGRYTVEDLNLNLCNLRDIDIEIARQEKVGFADVFWPMLCAGAQAQQVYGTNYAIAGKDGVHPGWAGHTVMAYAFLKAMGLDGQIGTFAIDLRNNTMKVSEGHNVRSANSGDFEIESSRYPFCACLEPGQAAKSYPVCGNDDVSKDSTIISGMSLVPFNQDLNRFMLVATHGKAAQYLVTWGNSSKSFSAEQLAGGVNLVEAFPSNPFSEAFAKVDATVAAKQAYETTQIKKDFHSSEAKEGMDAVVARTEKERAPFVVAVAEAFVPVTHHIKIQAQ
jgi:lysophospholipase L1-like esterase